MKKLIVLGALVLSNFSFGQNTFGEVVGKVILKKDLSTVYNAKIQTESNGTYYRARTDFDGRFRISAIPSGKYRFMVIFEGDTLDNIEASVPIDGIVNLGTVEFTPKTTILQTVVVKPHTMPRLGYGVAPEIKMDRDQIKHSPQKFDQKSMIASMSSDIKLTDDGSLVFRGSRKGDMIYMIDGVKLKDISNMPSAAIGGMMVYTGGIPAKYGDTTGGVVVMESLSYFDLYRNWVSMQLNKE